MGLGTGSGVKFDLCWPCPLVCLSVGVDLLDRMTPTLITYPDF